MLGRPVSKAAARLATALIEDHQGAAVMLYGSGNSVLKHADPADILFDFYVITPSYGEYYRTRTAALFNRLIPPNVYYFERETDLGLLRAKYAVLSIDHFERLASWKTFHSYFWARFAQPSKIVSAPTAMRARLIGCVAASIDAFIANSRPLCENPERAQAVWRAGLTRSYKAELRAEQPDRVEKLLDEYGDWPERVYQVPDRVLSRARAEWRWRLRVPFGGFLSVMRLLKGAVTFDGGIDYIAWKISRHSGVDVPIRSWERRWPVLGAPFVTARYYKMKRAAD